MFKLSTYKNSTVAPLIAMLWNLLVVYTVYSVCRIEYLLENWQYFEAAWTEGYLHELLWGGVVFDTPGIFYTNLLWIVLMMVPCHWKERSRTYQKVLHVLFVVVNALAVVLNLADSVYFRFTLRRSSLAVVNEFSGEGSGELTKILGTEVLNHWYLVVLFVILTWVLHRLYMTPQGNTQRVKYYTLQTISLLATAVLCVSGIRGGYLNHWYLYFVIGAVVFYYNHYRGVIISSGRVIRGRGVNTNMVVATAVAATAIIVLLLCAWHGGWRHRDIRPVAVSNATEYCRRPTEASLVLNTPFVLIRTVGKDVFNDPHYYDDKADLDAIFLPVRNSGRASEVVAADSIAEGPMLRKNVVILIVESFGREYIGAMNRPEVFPGTEGYKTYTPFADSLLQHCAWWRYSFCNGRKSIDGMPSILSSIPMFEKPFILTPQAMNHLEGIGTLLAGEGYQTAFFHGATRGSMGFMGFARSIGFRDYYGREDYEGDKELGSTSDFDGYWAVWDEPWLQYYARKMTQMQEPFVTAVFTASSHHPFQLPEQYVNVYPEEELKIHKCIRYTDNALREFFRTARQQPWYRNTVFVLTSDHTNMSNHAEYSSDIGGFMAPVALYDPSGELFTAGMRDGVAQQIDIMPTILSLLRYRKPYVAFGKDLLPDAAARTCSGAASGLSMDDWAVNFLNGVYQYVRYGLVLQWDGRRTIGLYALSDRRMQHNLLGSHRDEQRRMEREVKAIIQSYMDRMTTDRLTAK